MILAKQVLKIYVEHISKLENGVLEEIAKFGVEQLRPKASYYIDELMAMARLLAEVYEASKKYIEAAKAMGLVDLNTSRVLTSEGKASWLIDIMMFYIFGKDPIAASSYVNFAHREINNVKDPALLLKFKVWVCLLFSSI